MRANSKVSIRCAIYTRKSTEHGLELEFNSLHAQREACEAYIKSQTQEGWMALPRYYDDPAYSGGNLERPSLQRLLADIEAGRIDVVVVYKIDRLTRSLADFARLIEIFDKNTVSFVAITQQFNTTTSMGRLTLNVLLSFAQFERELSSERVRDKVAASRKKGKWTGGGIPLGYDTKDKKLIVNQPEAETVRYIYRRYLELKCLRSLIADLDGKRIAPKQRTSRSGRKLGAARFTYGALAYLLKNRFYLGEIGHQGHWFPGEHEAIVNPALFDAVQNLLRSNSIKRHQQRSNNQSLLTGLLFDDRDNRMSPSFTTKRGVRYRFYVSKPILSGRHQEAGSVKRISAADIESGVVSALRKRSMPDSNGLSDQDLIATRVERIVVTQTKLVITLKADNASGNLIEVEITQPQSPASPRTRIENEDCQTFENASIGVIHALARAHLWLKALSEGAYQSVEELGVAVKWNSKVIRKALRLAFLAPDITEAIIFGRSPRTLSLSVLQEIGAYSWGEQRRLLGFPVAA